MRSVVYGFFYRYIIALIPISLVDIFGIEFLKISYAIITFCSGIAMLIGPPLVGWLKVYFGTYDIPFAVVAGVFYVGGILAFIYSVYTRE